MFGEFEDIVFDEWEFILIECYEMVIFFYI